MIFLPICFVSNGYSGKMEYTMKLKRSFVVFGLSWVLIGSPAGLAQDGQVEIQSGNLRFVVDGGYELTFDTDIDDSSEFNLSTTYITLAVQSQPTDDLSVMLSFDYTIDDYDFDGSSGIGGLDPWDDIHTQTIKLTFTHQIANDWRIFGGPIAVFSRESGASFEDSDSYGGFVGFSYSASASFTIGGGFGLLDRLEDDSDRSLPIIILNWQLRPDLRLSSSSNTRRSGLELVYDLDDTIELAIGAAYEYSRFRLDDDGPAPDGIGELTSLPITARATFTMNDNLNLTVLGGLRVGGEITLENSDGDEISEEDFDNSIFAGVSFSIRF